MAKKPKFEKLSINYYRRGELRYETAYNAREAARKATKMAKQGWEATVQSFGSLGTKRGVHMTCGSQTRGWADKRKRDADKMVRPFAKCTMTPAFKKRIKVR